MSEATNPLKWQGIKALTARGLCQFKLPRKLGGEPVFYFSQSEIVPVFIFTPNLKCGAANTAGFLGLSFSDVDEFAKRFGKVGSLPSFMIHTANFPGDLRRYVTPDEAERGVFEDWAGLMARCLRSYPTSAKELAMQLRDGRLGDFRADQQFRASPLNEALHAWFVAHGITVPPIAPLPIEAVKTSSSVVQ